MSNAIKTPVLISGVYRLWVSLLQLGKLRSLNVKDIGCLDSSFTLLKDHESLQRISVECLEASVQTLDCAVHMPQLLKLEIRRISSSQVLHLFWNPCLNLLGPSSDSRGQALFLACAEIWSANSRWLEWTASIGEPDSARIHSFVVRLMQSILFQTLDWASTCHLKFSDSLQFSSNYCSYSSAKKYLSISLGLPVYCTAAPILLDMEFSDCKCHVTQILYIFFMMHFHSQYFRTVCDHLCKGLTPCWLM